MFLTDGTPAGFHYPSGGGGGNGREEAGFMTDDESGRRKIGSPSPGAPLKRYASDVHSSAPRAQKRRKKTPSVAQKYLETIQQQTIEEISPPPETAIVPQQVIFNTQNTLLV